MTLLADRLAEIADECDHLVNCFGLKGWAWQHTLAGIEKLRNPVEDIAGLLARSGLTGKASDFKSLWDQLDSWITLSSQLSRAGKEDAMPSRNRLLKYVAQLGKLARSVLQYANDIEEIAPPSRQDTHKAVWLGDGKVRIGEETISLEPQLADVLQALTELQSATTPQLQTRSGRDDPGRLLKRLVNRFPQLKPYIRFPGGRGKGGYQTTIQPDGK